MANANSISAARPSVRLAKVNGRPIELRYYEDGKRKRVSTGTHDEAEAERQRAELEAKLILGIQPKKAMSTGALGLDMPWDGFRNEYRRIHLAALSDKSEADADSRLDITQRILKPKTIRDVAERLGELQTQLLAGAESRFKRPRSALTVKSHMRSVIAALNWGRKQGWYPDRFDVAFIKVEDADDMKGRPLVGEEFDRMIDATKKVVGEQAADSWTAILNAVRNSGLRLGEIMNLSWDIPQTIQPIWRKGRFPVLWFPGQRQKNRKSQEIPLCPWLEEQLLQIPEDDRTGYVFNPMSLELKIGRKPRYERLSAEHVGKVISRIGKKAGVIVDEGNSRTGTPKKFASVHDLRRTFAVRLADSGLPPQLTRKLMRHADLRTTERYYLTENVQRDAGQIRSLLISETRRSDKAAQNNRENAETHNE